MISPFLRFGWEYAKSIYLLIKDIRYHKKCEKGTLKEVTRQKIRNESLYETVSEAVAPRLH